jgi:hypothetical protein
MNVNEPAVVIRNSSTNEGSQLMGLGGAKLPEQFAVNHSAPSVPAMMSVPLLYAENSGSACGVTAPLSAMRFTAFELKNHALPSPATAIAAGLLSPGAMGNSAILTAAGLAENPGFAGGRPFIGGAFEPPPEHAVNPKTATSAIHFKGVVRISHSKVPQGSHLH